MIGRGEFGQVVIPHEFCREFGRVSSAVALFYILTVTGSSSGKMLGGDLGEEVSSRIKSRGCSDIVSRRGAFR